MMCAPYSFHHLISPSRFSFLPLAPKTRSKIAHHPSHKRDYTCVHTFYFPYQKITMASPCSARLAFMYFLSLPGFSYLCECVYMMTERNEWVERNVNGKTVYYMRRVDLLSAAWFYILINFPTLVLPISLDVAVFVVIFCIPFMSTLTYHHPFYVFSSHAHRSCVGELEKLSSRYSSNVYGFSH
jgi:hypothetical protein